MNLLQTLLPTDQVQFERPCFAHTACHIATPQDLLGRTASEYALLTVDVPASTNNCFGRPVPTKHCPSPSCARTIPYIALVIGSCLMCVSCHPIKPAVVAAGSFNGEVQPKALRSTILQNECVL